MDSRPISKALTDEEKHHDLKEIKEDASYFRRTYKRADVRVNLAGLGIDEGAVEVMDAIAPWVSERTR